MTLANRYNDHRFNATVHKQQFTDMAQKSDIINQNSILAVTAAKSNNRGEEK